MMDVMNDLSSPPEERIKRKLIFLLICKESEVNESLENCTRSELQGK